MLNPESPLPLYHQLADTLQARMADGTFQPGSKLPSEPTLAREYGVARPTVREATRLLTQRRLIQTRRGSGSFVLEPPRSVDLFSLGGTLESFESSGIQLTRSLVARLAKVHVPEDQEHNPFAGRSAYCFTRLSRVKRKPVLLEEMYADPQVFPGLEAYNLSAASFASIVRDHYFMEPSRALQSFQLAHLDEQRAPALGLESGDAVLLVRRTLDFPVATQAIHTELYCRTDQFAFTQTLEATPHA